ncbi:phosphatase PAP2 family protein [Oceanobacillus damuensis]|uniref:phosphatase PAP2 family protein n=1 Tax=Oceanobacillus damuensis TaxID=937928 RepID=UPI000836FA7B|nr:phosphatase PAP2 family protein [Oceanobacillus damuensis]
MDKLFAHFYTLESQLCRFINQYFSQRHLNLFFSAITHLGGSIVTISSLMLLILFTSGSLQLTAIASAVSLTLSHIPVIFSKKLFPRKRPYISLPHIYVSKNPLKDHSFPSGHTTAIFSIITPFVLIYPTLTVILLPIAFVVGLSRIYLGLHYPSDVIVGCMLGSSTGMLSFAIIETYFPSVFI